jgi:hypothetical protein
MKPLLLLTMLASLLVQAPPVHNGVIEGKVTRPSAEGISDVQVTLVGPSPVTSVSALGSLYTPNASLTPGMRDQIDNLINSAPPGVTLQVVANAAIRMEAQLLGLPVPPLVPPLPPVTNQTVSQPPQTVVVTDREGVFSFKNLAPGRYQIRAQREGYFGTLLPGAVGIGAPTIVNTTATVNAGQPTLPVSITMLRGAIVSGRVRDPNGQPLSTAQVGAYQITYQNGRKTLQQVNSKQTDDRGEYRLYWLPPGDYVIGTVPRRLAAAAPTPQDAYARTFFPNAVDARQSQILHVAEGAEINGTDILIRPDATGRISGKVLTSFVGPNGQPSIASIFYLFALDPTALADTNLPTFPNASSNRASGQFELRGILPGPYELMSNVPDGNGRQAWGRTRVNVNGDANDVALSIQPGVEVRIRMTVDGALPAFTMQNQPAGGRGGTSVSVNGVVTTTAGPQAPTGQVPMATNRVQLRSSEFGGTFAPFESMANQDVAFDPASGTFTFKSVLPGKYAINVLSLPLNGYVADVRGAGASVMDAGVDISSQTGEVEVVLKTDGKRIEGVVRDASQKGAAAARVALVPSAPSRRQNIQLYKTANTDNAGKFAISGVAPGDYKLFAWEAVPNTAWMNAEFMALYEARGQAVTVGSTPTVNVELKLIPKD